MKRYRHADRVVLVDDWDDAIREQLAETVAGIQVAAALSVYNEIIE